MSFCPPLISAVICTKENGPALSNCKHALQNQRGNWLKEIIVKESCQQPDRWSGFKAAQARLVLFLDADCELSNANTLEKIVEFFSSHPEVAAVTGRYINAPQASYLAQAYNFLCQNWLHYGLLSPKRNLPYSPSQNLLGGIFILDRSRLPRLERDDFGHGWGGEDTFLARRLWAKNYPVYYWPHLAVFHHNNTSLRQWLRRAFWQGYHRRHNNLRTRGSFKNIEIFRTLVYSPPLILHHLVMFSADLMARWWRRPKTI